MTSAEAYEQGGTGTDAPPPPKYFKQLVSVPPQYFQQTYGSTKNVLLQYLSPSFDPSLITGWMGSKRSKSWLRHFWMVP